MERKDNRKIIKIVIISIAVILLGLAIFILVKNLTKNKNETPQVEVSFAEIIDISNTPELNIPNAEKTELTINTNELGTEIQNAFLTITYPKDSSPKKEELEAKFGDSIESMTEYDEYVIEKHIVTITLSVDYIKDVFEIKSKEDLKNLINSEHEKLESKKHQQE